MSHGAIDVPLPLLETPPAFCQYVHGPCDQDYSVASRSHALFLYGSRPEQIAAIVRGAASSLSETQPSRKWLTWEGLDVGGQIIFCEVAKAIRFTEVVVADVTTLNFNLLFEIGFAIGLGKPVIPIRDTSLQASKKDFAALGILDALGYQDFQNVSHLVALFSDGFAPRALPPPPRKAYVDAPLYVMKGHVDTEGAIRLMSTLKKSGLSFRTYDRDEVPRLSLSDARRQVAGSFGIVAHLLHPDREDATSHNALCALVCGMALAEQKVVVMLQEEMEVPIVHPLDYRDVVLSYHDPTHIRRLLERPIRQIVEAMQRVNPRQVLPAETALERIDIGDPAAENEIGGLREYFVRTAQFRRAVQGHARLVVGRKGTGKSAIFYEIRDAVAAGHSHVVLDLRPEGHQFKKLREAVLRELPEGTQEHTVTAFWNYILLCEIAHEILETETFHAERDPQRWIRYSRLQELYFEHELAYGEDLSQRLLRQVDRLIERFGALGGEPATRDRLTEIIYGGDVRALDDAVSDYLQEKEAVWLLIDNLDKGWPTRGASTSDVLIVRCLLEAARKLQSQLEDRDVAFKCVVFLRTDIYELLVSETPDKGKDTAISLDAEDPEVFREIVNRRIQASADVDGEFSEVWPAFFPSHVGTEESFAWMLERTLMRSRDLLTFLQAALDVAINRGHARVTADDLRHAEERYSQEMLVNTSFEIEDTHPELRNVLFEFRETPRALGLGDVMRVLESRGLSEREQSEGVELLVWFGFLGVVPPTGEDELYAYQVRYDVRQLLHLVADGRGRLVVHPAFRRALSVA